MNRLLLAATLSLTTAAWAADAPDLTKMEALLESDANNIRLASEYRQAVIRAKEYDRCIKFFEQLVTKNPGASNAFLNYGFAYVDKIPVAGSITQVLLANTALSHFSRSIELKSSWIGLYTRGNSYLYWPKIFGRAALGVADLEKAMELQKQDKLRSYHVRAYISLGDGYWKTDQLDKAKATWQEGLKHFPNNEGLKSRVAKEGDDLRLYIDDVLDPNKRVDTDLHELWESK